MTTIILMDGYAEEHKTRLLKRLYEHSTPEERDAMDTMSIALCGWSLNTLTMEE